MSRNELGIQLLPYSSEPWQGQYFCQQTKFQYGGKQVSLALLLKASNPDPFTLRLAETAWEQATTTAFAHRSQAPEQLIEQILKSLNQTLETADTINGGGLLLLDRETIHFSTTGEVSVFLTSDNQTTKVSGDEASPNKFAAVTSGPLSPDDILVVTSSSNQKLLAEEQSAKLLEAKLLDYQSRALWVGSLSRQNLPVTRKMPDTGVVLKKTQAFLGHSVDQVRLLAKNINWRALPKFSLPKFSPTRPRFRLGSVVSLIVLACLLGGIGFGVVQLKNRLQKANTPAAPAITLLSRLKETAPTETVAFLSKEFSPEQYRALTQADQDSFGQVLAERSITLPKTEITQEFPENVISANLVGTKLFLVDTTGQLWRQENSTLSKIQQNGLIINPTQLLAFKEDRLLVTDQTGNVWLFDGSETQPISLPLPKEVATGKKKLARYQNNLYIFQETNRTIYRVSGFDRDITGLSTYAKLETLGISDSQDFRIFGDAVSVSSAGSVQLFRRNQLLGSAFISPIIPVSSLNSNETGTEVTLTANRFVSSYKSTGELLSQKFIPTEEVIIQTLQENNLPKYLLTAKKLYKIL